jgi:mono/diheme cytochrome c family protein
MSKKFTIGLVGLSAVLSAALLTAGFGPAPRVRYAHVKPVFDKYCVGCHGPRLQAGGLRLDSYAAIMKGGEDGKILVPKNPAKSLIIKYIEGTLKPRMPKGKPPLTAHNQRLISDWIKLGAAK